MYIIVKKLNFTACLLMAKEGSKKDSLLLAMHLLDSAISLDKSYYNSYQNRSTAEGMLGKYVEAINDIDQVLKIKNNLAEEKAMRGFILEKLNHNDEALKSYNEAIIDYKARLKKDSTNLKSQIDIAFLTMLTKNKNEGIIEYKKIIKKYPNDQRVIMLDSFFYSFVRKTFIDAQVGNHGSQY